MLSYTFMYYVLKFLLILTQCFNLTQGDSYMKKKKVFIFIMWPYLSKLLILLNIKAVKFLEDNANFSDFFL